MNEFDKKNVLFYLIIIIFNLKFFFIKVPSFIFKCIDFCIFYTVATGLGWEKLSFNSKYSCFHNVFTRIFFSHYDVMQEKCE